MEIEWQGKEHNYIQNRDFWEKNNTLRSAIAHLSELAEEDFRRASISRKDRLHRGRSLHRRRVLPYIVLPDLRRRRVRRDVPRFRDVPCVGLTQRPRVGPHSSRWRNSLSTHAVVGSLHTWESLQRRRPILPKLAGAALQFLRIFSDGYLQVPRLRRHF